MFETCKCAFMILWYFHKLHTVRALATIKVMTLLLFQEFDNFANLNGFFTLNNYTLPIRLHIVGFEE